MSMTFYVTFQGSVEHCVIGVQILYHLVMEMNLAESMRSLSKHRKVASSFRDESLYDIFTLSCTLLRQINVHDKTQVRIYDGIRTRICLLLANYYATHTPIMASLSHFCFQMTLLAACITLPLCHCLYGHTHQVVVLLL